MSHSIFDIEKHKIDKLICDKKNTLKWDKYDEHCHRAEIKLPIDMINNIYQLTGLKYKIDVKQTLCHYVKYDVNSQYMIDKHDDHCKITVLIYLSKDDNIVDKFLIEDTLVNTNKCWNTEKNLYGCVCMWSDDEFGPVHSVEITGKGLREILCVFLG